MDYVVSDSSLISVADAIREKGGTSEELAFPQEWIDSINNNMFNLEEIAYHRYGVNMATDPRHPQFVLNLDGITKLYPYAFYRATSIKRVESNTLKIFNSAANDTTQGDGGFVFANCNYLQSVYLPEFIFPGSQGNQFASCLYLTDVYMPKLGAIAYRMFTSCVRLEKVAFPGLQSASPMNKQGFSGCSSLVVCDLGPTTKLDQQEFSSCRVLTTLILRRTGSITQLGNINAFTGSPFASGQAGGTLYVPQDLIDSYKAATNWKTILEYTKDGALQNQILPIEGSYYETHYGDDREIPTTE